ncbi:hypothetical protein F66182_7955 [Fusarium sp. NRRL 66182]|nr:hypothetical protein F66182_7955 [Fusarium sp. NRRL 66182]
MACSATLNSSYPRYCGLSDHEGNALCTIQPDPDIAGVGVFASFITIGLTTMILAFYQILRDQEDMALRQFFKPTSWMEDYPLTDDNGHRIIDPSLANARRWVEANYHPLTYGALDMIVSALADTQFFMGIAIAAAMSKHDIVVAHFHLCDEMAWLGFITSSLSLLTTRSVNAVKGNSAKRVVRLVLTWALFGLIIHRYREMDDQLFYAQKIHEYGPPVPYLRWDFSYAVARASIFLLFWSIGGIIVETLYLSPTLTVLTDQYITTAIRGAWSLTLEGWPGQHYLFRYSLRGISGFLYFILVCLHAMFWEPLCCNIGNLGFFIWSVHDAFQYRNIGHSCMAEEDMGAENELGFGQIVALVLLLTPVASTADLWWGECILTHSIQSSTNMERCYYEDLVQVSFVCGIS